MLHIILGQGENRSACIQKFKNKDAKFYGKKLFVPEDFSKRVMLQRKENIDVFKRLKEERRKPFFLCPDKLAYRQATGKLVAVSNF